MMPFCSLCGNLLFVEAAETGKLRFACKLCPLFRNITKTLASRKAWKNVDSTEETCPKCSHPKAYFMQLQTRSADEPMTTFYRCCNHECSHNWRD
ncbi:hypothetical protein RN001_009931 [Aquatica leii]|uniref:DNA-directed RNA polymerase III subunit RPC10 n=1 Tax=Aquatica leii TaxID=1421715 RepID=A0AAN7SQ44_9COLE|nr:hypothetical protein RN001_009931 [Aquatica leii]